MTKKYDVFCSGLKNGNHLQILVWKRRGKNKSLEHTITEKQASKNILLGEVGTH